MTSPQEDGGEGGGSGQFEEAHAGSDHLILVDGLRKAWSHGTGPQTGLVKSLGKSGKKHVVQVWSVAQFRDVFLPSIFKPVVSFNHAFSTIQLTQAFLDAFPAPRDPESADFLSFHLEF